jgi:hypothetical protein
MGRHRIVPIPEVGTLVSVTMAAVFAFVSEILRNLWFFWKEVTGRVVGNLSEDAFRMTALTAQHPFRVGRHDARMASGEVIENRADTLLISKSGSGFYCERRTVFT